MSALHEIRIFPLSGVPEVKAGDDLARIIADTIRKLGWGLEEGDVLVVAQKIISKAEGRIVSLDTVQPSARASEWAATQEKDARLIEVVLREAASIVKMERGLIVARTRHGFVCANAGVDCSNTAAGTATLLPEDPDASARQLRQRLGKEFGVNVGVIISDSFGRPWREGLANVALGVAGVSPLVDYRGMRDGSGNVLQMTVMARADEVASAAELVMGKTERVPVAIIRGISMQGASGSGRDLIRPADKDLFK
ncbi:MAG: coenzyme F420-0:L-glutamate ligase [Candidatus Acidiferrales bacterium]